MPSDAEQYLPRPDLRYGNRVGEGAKRCLSCPYFLFFETDDWYVDSIDILIHCVDKTGFDRH
jgi:hypothetical protein